MKQIIHFSIGGIAAKASAQLDTDCTTDYLDVSSKFNLFETVLIFFLDKNNFVQQKGRA